MRTVKSFVKRNGRITTGQIFALKKMWCKFGIDYTEKTLDLKRLFGNQSPVHIDIGFGDGNALIQEAEKNPKTNFIGIEVHRPGIGRCLMEIKKKQLSNILISSHDAQEVMKSQIKDDSLDRINLYFPDPWPKKRHHKRRIIQTEFLNLCAQKLKMHGIFCIATDWRNYAEHIDSVIDLNENFTIKIRLIHKGEGEINRPSTKFEKKGLKKGHLIWDWVLKKTN